MLALRGAQVAHFINPDAPFPAKEVAKDQHVLNYLLSSISREILVQVATCTTAAKILKAIQDMFTSQSRGHVINTRMALATAQKGSSTIAEFFSNMKSLVDDMASVRN